MENFIAVTITGRQELTPDIVALTLERADGGTLPTFTAGAHVNVYIDDHIVRQYSLCSSPSETQKYRLGILKEPKSRGGSRSLHEKFKIGDSITITEPSNLFPLEMQANHSILVGGGIGITPMIAMAYALKENGKSFTLHYCVRSHEQVAFIDELLSNFSEYLHLHCDDLDEKQRLNPLVDFAPFSSSTHIYTCGPTGFMDWVKASAKKLGYPKENIHFEYFTNDIDTSGEAFTVIAERSGKTINVCENQSIVSALAEAGIRVNVSCEQGICGTCIVDVIEGEPDHKDEFLTDEEKADNDQIAVCCSRSKSSILVLDI